MSLPYPSYLIHRLPSCNGRFFPRKPAYAQTKAKMIKSCEYLRQKERVRLNLTPKSRKVSSVMSRPTTRSLALDLPLTRQSWGLSLSIVNPFCIEFRTTRNIQMLLFGGYEIIRNAVVLRVKCSDFFDWHERILVIIIFISNHSHHN